MATSRKIIGSIVKYLCKQNNLTLEQLGDIIGKNRRLVPKKTNLIKVIAKQVMRVERLINNRPVRKFNCLTSNQVFSKKMALITLT